MRDLLIPDSPETPRVEMINHRGVNSAPVEKEVWGGLQLNDAQPAAPQGLGGGRNRQIVVAEPRRSYRVDNAQAVTGPRNEWVASRDTLPRQASLSQSLILRALDLGGPNEEGAVTLFRMASPDFTNAQLALQNACVQVEDERMKYLLAQRAAHERGLGLALKDS